MTQDFINYISLGVFGTGISLCLIRVFRILRAGRCFCKTEIRKTVVITGATSGLGKHCAIEMVERNCKLILGCRNAHLAEKVHRQIVTRHPSASILLLPLDLTNPDSVRQFTNRVALEAGSRGPDVLIHNAGVMAAHFRAVRATDSEEDMAVNFLSPFLLTRLLLLARTNDNASGDGASTLRLPMRVVFVASSLAKRGRLQMDQPDFSADPYNYMQAYSNSKLAVCLLARELQRQHSTDSLRVVTLFTGGMVHTGLARHVLAGYSFLVRPWLRILQWGLLSRPEEACHSLLHAALCTQPESALYSGLQPIDWPPEIEAADKPDQVRQLWSRSCEIVQVDWPLGS